MARRKTPRFGRWLVTQRKDRGWTQNVAIEALEKLTGVRMTRNWLSQLEGGEAPSADLRAAWERLYGPAPVEGGEEADYEALIAALASQTAAINALVKRLDVIAEPLGDAAAVWLEEQLRAANHLAESAAASEPARQPSARSPQGAT